MLRSVEQFQRVGDDCVAFVIYLFRDLVIFARGRFQAARFFQEVDARIFRRDFSFFDAALTQFRCVRDGFFERSMFCMSVRRRLVR